MLVMLLETKNYLNLAQFAKKHGLTRQAVSQAIKRGTVIRYHDFDGVVLIHKGEADKFPRRKY